MTKARPKIKGGITCTRCGHERFKFMKSCPKCDYLALSDLDTSTKRLVGTQVFTHLIYLAIIAKMTVLHGL